MKLSSVISLRHLRPDANGKYWTEYEDPKDIVTFPMEYYNLDEDEIGVIPGDGFWDLVILILGETIMLKNILLKVI